jgi:hypothetical protein
MTNIARELQAALLTRLRECEAFSKVGSSWSLPSAVISLPSELNLTIGVEYTLCPGFSSREEAQLGV